MPRPLGRDRLEPTTDETIVLLSLRPKPWSGREEVSPRAPVLPGTAVRWDGELYEVLRVEPRAGGGFRHVLAHWDDRYLVRTLVEYGNGGDPQPAVAIDEAPVPEDAPPAEPPAGPAAAAKGWRALSPALRALAVAFVPSILLGWFFPFRVMGEGISFLIHELGHTLVAWFFGCSAMPAIVMTIVFEQSRVFAALVWGGLVFLAVKYRRAPRWNVGLAVLAVLYPLVAFTQAYVAAFDLGGHLAEVAFATWAFHRAVRGERPEWERPVWAFFAFYLVARNVKLFGGVALSAAARTDYLTIAITGQNDLVKLAERTGVALTALAAMTAIVFLVVPLGVLALALRKPE
ncbi:MAG: hypothetical protein IPP07_10360 [Holophagales bacterium]|nr:hypothetical protein [Holophagales bacterium]MBK9965266.1 hypothetical protein [Holophagales bacterium]